jgi:hypothetical protein
MVSFEQLIFGVFYGILAIVALIYFFFVALRNIIFYIMFCMLFCRALAIRPGWFSMSL